MDLLVLKNLSLDSLLNFNNVKTNTKELLHVLKDLDDAEYVQERSYAISIIGSRYFDYEDILGFDFAVEQFNKLSLNKCVGQHKYGFLCFLFKCQIYTQAIDLDEADQIYKKYFGPTITEIAVNDPKWSKNNRCHKTQNQFAVDALCYQIEDEYDTNSKHELFFKQFIQFLKDIKLPF